MNNISLKSQQNLCQWKHPKRYINKPYPTVFIPSNRFFSFIISLYFNLSDGI